jgi:hypothetical protein
MEIGKDLGSSAEHDAVASLKGGVGDIFHDHCFSQAVGTCGWRIPKLGHFGRFMGSDFFITRDISRVGDQVTTS